MGLLYLDLVLQAMAERLRMVVRPGDTPRRLGGDEFVVVCGGLPGSAEAMDIAERLEAAISEPIDVGDTVLSVTASTGILDRRGGGDLRRPSPARRRRCDVSRQA